MICYEDLLSLVRKIEAFAEIVILSVMYYLIFDKYRTILGAGMFAYKGKYVLIFLYAIITYAVFKACDSLRFGNSNIIDSAVSQWISMLIVNIITYLQICLIGQHVLSPIPMLILTGLDFVVSIICIMVFLKINKKTTKKQGLTVIYGKTRPDVLIDKFNNKSDAYYVEQEIEYRDVIEDMDQSIGNASTVLLIEVPVSERKQILKYCYANSKTIFTVPSITDVIIKSADDVTIMDTPLTGIGSKGITFTEKVLKRTLDICIGAIVMIPASIVMIPITIAIKLEDGGPVFYRQKRVTIGDKEFDMLKFRSMIPDAEKFTGAVLATEDDPRITKVGKFLRATRLDELPQILNILKGDMSIVGPRPERRELIEKNCETMPEFAYRTKVKGGLTGYAQVYGKYNTTPYDKLKMDLMYIENYSALLDLKLLLMTPQIMFRKESTEGVKE